MILSRENIFPLMDAVAQRLIKSMYNGSFLEYQHVAELFAIASSIITWSGTALPAVHKFNHNSFFNLYIIKLSFKLKTLFKCSLHTLETYISNYCITGPSFVALFAAVEIQFKLFQSLYGG